MLKNINKIQIYSNCIVLLVFSVNQMVTAQERITGKSFATCSEVIARNGMAATSQPLELI